MFRDGGNNSSGPLVPFGSNPKKATAGNAILEIFLLRLTDYPNDSSRLLLLGACVLPVLGLHQGYKRPAT